MCTMSKTAGLDTLNRILFAFLLLSFFIGCTKGYRLSSQADPVCGREADEAIERGDYEEGIRLHLEILEKEPGNGLAMYHLGYAYGMAGDSIKEVESYEKAIALGYRGDADFYYNLGMALGELDSTQKAISALKRALEIDPESADIRVGLGLAYQADTDLRSAEEEFKKAIEKMPEHTDARFNLAVLYADSGDLQKAREQLKKILEIDPDRDDAREFLESIEKE